MDKIIPDKLKSGDEVRIIAPALSMSIISEETRRFANSNFEKLGLKLTFGKHIEESDGFTSSSIKSRITDLHDAFSDKKVKAIFTVIGGFNSNQLLEYIDWELIKKNPKIFCGYSDITALQNAMLAKTGLVTYSGPAYSTLGQKHLDKYNIDYLRKCLIADKPFEIYPPEYWTEDKWYINQDDRHPLKNAGYWVLNSGKAEGTLMGGNLCTINLLQGTQYMPSSNDVVLFIEDDEETDAKLFDRDLQSLLQTNYFKNIKGVVVGKFQKESKISKKDLELIINTKSQLNDIPVIANVDFGHTEPRITFPIGGYVKIEATKDKVTITVLEH